MEFLISLEVIILGATLVVNSALALLVYKNNPKSATNIILGLLSFITSVWLIVNHLALLPDFSSLSLIMSRFSIFLAVPQILLFFLLATTLPKDKIQLRKGVFWTILGLSFFIMLVNISPFAFKDIEFRGNSTQPITGPGIIPFAIFAISFSFGAIFVLFKRIRQSLGIIKQQLLFMMYGILAMLLLIIVSILIPVALLQNTTLVPLAPLYTLIFLGATTYAIIRHRMLDIRLIVARTVAFSILLGIISTVYVLPTIFVSSLLLGLPIRTSQLIIYTILTVVVALSFQRLREIIEKYTDKVFFKGQYKSDEVLSKLGKTMIQEIELKPLASNLLNTLISEMKITKGAFVLLNKNSIYDIESVNFPASFKISLSEVVKFIECSEFIVFDEVEENPVKELMRKLNISLVSVLRVKNKTIGLLLLGEKASGDIYSLTDIKTLSILSSEISVAIQNSLSYDEIKKFNITLQQEIAKATSELQEANIKLQELDKLKDDFVSIASHELRTPMTAIRSYAWMALHKPDISLSNKMKKYLERTLVSTERLINLVNDMLNVSRIESGSIKIIPEAFDIRNLVGEVLIEVDAKAKEKNLQMVNSNGKLPIVFADPNKVHQVLLNLIGNALKFTSAEGTITISYFTDGIYLDISIADTGVGIDKDDISRLFKKFSRLDSTYIAASSSGGTGLGLFICKSLIEKMGGRIWVQSNGANKGSVFTFSLPLATKELVGKASKQTLIPIKDVKMLEPVAIQAYPNEPA